METSENKIATGELVTGNFTIQAQMPMGKTITVSGYIYAHNSAESINKQVDLLHDVIDRQRTRSEIPELEAKMEQRHAALSNMRDALADMQKKENRGGKLTSAEKASLGGLNTSILKIVEDIEKGNVAITEAKKKAGFI